MSRLTRKINVEWDFNSLEGERTAGIVCSGCGSIVPLTYQKRSWGERFGVTFYGYCPDCFDEDRETVEDCYIGSPH